MTPWSCKDSRERSQESTSSRRQRSQNQQCVPTGDTPQSRTLPAPTRTKKISRDVDDDDDIHLDAVEEEDDAHDEGRHHAPAAHPVLVGQHPRHLLHVARKLVHPVHPANSDGLMGKMLWIWLKLKRLGPKFKPRLVLNQKESNPKKHKNLMVWGPSIQSKCGPGLVPIECIYVSL